MNILHLSPNYIPINMEIKHGGVERIIKSIIKKQSEKKEIKNIHLGAIEGSNLKDSKVHYIYPTNITNLLFEDNKQYCEKMENSCHNIISIIKEEKIDVLHDHFGYFSSSCLGRNYIKNSGIPTVVSIYGLPNNPYYTKIYDDLSKIDKLPNVIINCVSHAHFNMFKSRLNVKDIVYNGVDIDEFYTDLPKRDYYLSLASLIPEKGHLEHINWAKKFKKKLLIIGKEDPEQTSSCFMNKIKEETFLLKINDQKDVSTIKNIMENLENHKIVRIDEVTEETKKILLSSSKALLYLVSWMDPFPLTVLESLASGTPVIVNHTDSLREVINCKNGLIVNNHLDFEIDSYLHKIEKEDCIQSIQNFSSEKMTNNYMHLYYKVMKEVEK
ncbi:glycosyltransferase [Staphylococcus epidermidis]|nr:glycosyltransferase [Staphylococcus epidermidis]